MSAEDDQETGGDRALPIPQQAPTVDSPHIAVVDWGTSTFRLWTVTRGGMVCGTSRGPEGIGSFRDKRFDETLLHHLDLAGAPVDLPVLMCGMVGSRQGWVEVPYVELPARLDLLGSEAVRVALQERDIRIIPGLAQKNAHKPDVMRGEETQLFGLRLPDRALVCMPGTHCKWVMVEARVVTSFTTFMTGELYALLSRQSILRHAINNSHEEEDGETFRDALRSPGLRNGRFLSQLFSLRAADLLGFFQGAAGDRLSALLIGAEVAEVRLLHGTDMAVTLVGEGTLADRYGWALETAGFSVQREDAEIAARRGLTQVANSIWSRRQ